MQFCNDLQNRHDKDWTCVIVHMRNRLQFLHLFVDLCCWFVTPRFVTTAPSTIQMTCSHVGFLSRSPTAIIRHKTNLCNWPDWIKLSTKIPQSRNYPPRYDPSRLYQPKKDAPPNWVSYFQVSAFDSRELCALTPLTESKEFWGMRRRCPSVDCWRDSLRGGAVRDEAASTTASFSSSSRLVWMHQTIQDRIEAQSASSSLNHTYRYIMISWCTSIMVFSATLGITCT